MAYPRTNVFTLLSGVKLNVPAAVGLLRKTPESVLTAAAHPPSVHLLSKAATLLPAAPVLLSPITLDQLPPVRFWANLVGYEFDFALPVAPLPVEPCPAVVLSPVHSTIAFRVPAATSACAFTQRLRLPPVKL